MRKTWWLEARKDFTFHRRTPRVAGEVFQELVPIAAQLVHKKLAKRVTAPADAPQAGPPSPPPPVAEPESPAPADVIDDQVVDEPPSLVDDSPAVTDAPDAEAPIESPVQPAAEPVSTRRRRKGKFETSGDAD